MVFLWVFLPAVILLALIFRKRKTQNIILLLASLLFYAWGEPRYIFLLLFSICINWLFGILMDHDRQHAKCYLILSVIANLSLLGYFKYTNFAMRTLRAFGIPAPETNVVLPIGISFFTFQAMSYVIDLYRGKYKVQKNILNLALYISFFPQLIAGPIVMYRDIEEQIENRTITLQKVSSGIRRFIYGLGKKVIISNLVAITVDAIYNGYKVTEISSGMAWCAAILYTLQIYYDFSGYSDMAIGLGRIFGFEFLENFNYPYISRSIREFWRRWHISLSSWFRDYLYIPLGGNRKGKVRTYINLAIVFFMTGLWHGASWNFVFWGMFHGFFLIIERIGFGKVLDRSKIFSRVYTCLIFVVGWVFFRVTSLSEGFRLVARMFMPWRYTSSAVPLGTLISRQTICAAIAGMVGCGILQSFFMTKKGAAAAARWKGSMAEGIYLAAVMALSIVLLAGNTYNPFIYFQF